MSEKLAPVTDPTEIEEITRDRSDLSKPFPISPNGHPWVDVDELRDWRESRK